MSFEKVTRLDALTVRKDGEKSYWTRIGVAWPAKQGPGWNVVLDAMPAPTEGQFKIFLMEPKPKQEPAASGQRNEYDQSSPFPEDDRTIPF